jgi:hypothetical protein
VRRGRRRDFAQVRSLVDADAGARLERVFRRIVADLGTDVYVAESGDGEIVGLVRGDVRAARCCAAGSPRCSTERGHAASAAVLDGLVAFAEERARKRGCDRLSAWVAAEDADLRATLVARGYRAGELLVAELG